MDNSFKSLWHTAELALWRTNACAWRSDPVSGHEHWLPGERYWWVKLTADFKLHPVVERAIEDNYRPVDWQRMLLEWPHISTDDSSCIAYTRDEKAGRDYPVNGSERQTKTSVGKYLSRHWPHVPDHVRRTWAGRYTPDSFAIWEDVEDIISSVELGPQSCMHSSYGTTPFTARDNIALHEWFKNERCGAVRWERHAYYVYQPRFGWRAAVRLRSGMSGAVPVVDGRCLVNINDNTFVRSYKRDPNDGYSHADEQLEAWLVDQGYTKEYSWHGKCIAKVQYPNNRDCLMVPYLDGRSTAADDGGTQLRICSTGNYDGTNTDANGGEGADTSIGSCDRCGDIIDEDDTYITLGDGDACVCEYCADRAYVRVTGTAHSRCEEYYILQCDAIEVNGTDYDSEHLPDYIVCLADGDYAHHDDVVYSDEEGEYYLCSDSDVVYVDGEWYCKTSDTVVLCDDDEYRKRDDCWMDAETEQWYADDEAYIGIDGKTYHPRTLLAWKEASGQLKLEMELS